MSEEENPRGFKVVDRRRFNTEGDAREEIEDEPEVEAVEPAPAAAPVTSPANSPPSAAPTASSAAPAQKTSADVVEDEHDPDAISFTQFLQSLATQAMMQLGMVPHPATNQRELHLEGARDTLDILALLQRKTKGNLTDEESKLCEAMLYELRMAYVEVTKSVASQPAPGAPGGPQGPGGQGPLG